MPTTTSLLGRDEVIKILSAHRTELCQQYRIKSMALFGSVARNEASETSDLDLLVEFDRSVTLFDLVALQQHLETLLGIARVEIAIKDAIYPALREAILAEAVDVH